MKISYAITVCDEFIERDILEDMDGKGTSTHGQSGKTPFAKNDKKNFGNVISSDENCGENAQELI